MEWIGGENAVGLGESSASGRIFGYASLCRLLKLTVVRRNGSAFYASKWRFCFLLPDAMRSAIGFGTDNGRESIGGALA